MENAAERIREAKKKKVAFAADTKTTDGKGKMERRSERLKAKKKKVMDDEQFVRRIEAKGPVYLHTEERRNRPLVRGLVKGFRSRTLNKSLP